MKHIDLPRADNSHALLSPSSAHRWAHCIGSTPFGKSLPRPRAGVYADEGTVAHTISAWALDAGVPCELFVGQVLQTESGPIEVTEDMAGYCQTYVDAVTAASDGHYSWAEVALDISRVTNQPGATGAGDYVILHSDRSTIEVHDLKYGRGVQVSPIDNDQLIMYFFGAVETLGRHIPGLRDSVKTFRGVIHQPRISRTPAVWEVPASQLWSRYDWYKSRAEKILAYMAQLAPRVIKLDVTQWPDFDGAPFVQSLTPGEKSCEWCHCKAHCPALSAQVAETTMGLFGDETNQPSSALTTWQAYSAPRFVQSMTMDEIGRVLLRRDMIESFLVACYERAMAEAQNGHDVPYQKLVRGRPGNRAWADEGAALDVLGDDAKFTQTKIKSVAEVEKLLKKQPELWAQLAPLITCSEGKLSLVPVTDLRDTVQVEKITFDNESE